MTIPTVTDQNLDALKQIDNGLSLPGPVPPTEPTKPFTTLSDSDVRVAQAGGGPLRILGNLFEPAVKALKEGDPTTRSVEELIPDEQLDDMYDAVTDPAGPRDPFKVGGINLNRLDTAQDVKTVIEKVGELNARTNAWNARGSHSFETTEQLAEQFAKELGDEGIAKMILERERGGTFNAEQMLAARSLYLRTTEDMVQHAHSVINGGGPQAIAEFRHRLALSSAIHAQLKGAQTEAARTLSAFRISALGGPSIPSPGQPENAATGSGGGLPAPVGGQAGAVEPVQADPSGPYIQREILDLVERTGGEATAIKAAEAILDAHASGDLGFVSKVARKTQGKDMIDLVQEAWLSGLVSSPDTWGLALAGNAMVAMVRNGEHWVAGLQAGLLRQDMAGFMEPFMYTWGQVQGGLSGLVLAGRTLALGEAGMASKYTDGTFQPSISADTIRNTTVPFANKQSVGETWDQMAARSGFMEPAMLQAAGASGAIVDFSGELIRVPFRVLAAEDQLFRSMSYNGELQVGAMRWAMQQPGDMMENYRLAMNEPEKYVPDVHLKSLAQAREDTLQQPGGNDWFSNANRLVNHPVGKVFMKPIFPFMRVINNSMQWTWDRMPLLPEAVDMFRQAGPENRWNLLLNNAEQDFTVGGFLRGSPERDQQIAKMVSGTTLLLGGWYASTTGAFQGLVGEGDAKVREGAKLMGLQGTSLVFERNGETVQFDINRLDPVVMPFVISAMTNEALALAESEEEQNSIVLAGVMAMRDVMSDKTALSGLNDVMKTMFAPHGSFDDKLINFISRRMASGVPSFAAKLSRTADGERPYYEDPKASNPYDTDWLRFLSEMNNRMGQRMPRAWAKANDIPGWDELPNHVDLFGRPVARPTGYPMEWISFIGGAKPRYSREQLNNALPEHLQNTMDLRRIRLNRDISESELETLIDLVGADGELQRLGMPVSVRQRKWKGVKLAPHQYEYLKRLEGPLLQEALEDVVFGPAYLDAPEVEDIDGSKQQMLEAAARDVRQEIDKALETDPEWSLVMQAKRLREQVAEDGVAPRDPLLPETEPGEEITPTEALQEFLGGKTR